MRTCGTRAVIVIVTPEGKRTITHGTVAEGNPRPIDGDTVFRVASVTKVFTAVLLADMVQRGELGLDDPAARHLRNAAGSIPSRDGRPITLVDLATHTSGLPLRPDNLVAVDADNNVQSDLGVDANGLVTAAIWHQFGQDQRGERIP